MGLIRVLNKEGHGEIRYNPENDLELAAAVKRFKELKGQGLSCLAIVKSGEGGVYTERLVPDAYEHIFMRPLVGG